MIIVEGPDNSGKSTLITHIQDWLGDGDTYPVIKSIGPKADYDWWMGQLTQPPTSLLTTIRDRFFFSELVYGPIFRGKTSVDFHQQEVIMSLVEATSPLVVVCKLIKDEASFNNRPQQFPWEKMEEIDRGFQHLNYGLTNRIHMDVKDEDAYDALHNALDRWVKNRVTALSNRLKCSYGRGPMGANLMVVGISFSRNNKWKVPFERSISAHVLHDLIRRSGFNPLNTYFTNAEKEPGGLTPSNLERLRREFEVIRPIHVLSLGRLPSVMLSALHIPHLSLTHPGSAMRRGDVALKEWLVESIKRLNQNKETVQ